MGFYDNGMNGAIAACVGTTSLALGGPGTLETVIGLGTLGAHIWGKHQKFGPECQRLRKKIQNQLKQDYADYIVSEGDSWFSKAELQAADDALKTALDDCKIDGPTLAKCTQNDIGFVAGATALVMASLDEARPDLFSTAQKDSLAYRYASDVVRLCFEESWTNRDFYENLEPLIIAEMASAIGRIEAKLDGTIEALTIKVAEQAKAFGIKEGLLVALARRYAEGSPDNFEDALKGLENALDVAHKEMERGRLPSNVDAALNAVLQRVDKLNEQGLLDEAEQALEAELALMDEEDARREAARLRLYDKAIAQATLTRSPEKVAQHLLAKLRLGALNEPDFRQLFEDIWKGYYTRGSDKGINFDLEIAIRLLKNHLDQISRETDRDYWAMIQNNLGAVLSALGERESDTKRLEQAVIAYQEALKEYTQELVPLPWAATQNNLGNAFRALGERESDTTRLKQAVIAYQEALKEYKQERVPLDWAMTQNNLGNVLRVLGERERGTTRLEQAVSAFQEALKEGTQERVPLDWAMTQNNLGIVLISLGERESDTKRLEQAVIAFQEALKERTQERVPLDWAGTQNNLGIVLKVLGERKSDTKRLEQAVIAYQEALKEYTQERVPLLWAGTNLNLALLYHSHISLERQNGDETEIDVHRQQAMNHIQKALMVFNAEDTPAYFDQAMGVKKSIEDF